MEYGDEGEDGKDKAVGLLWDVNQWWPSPYGEMSEDKGKRRWLGRGLMGIMGRGAERVNESEEEVVERNKEQAEDTEDVRHATGAEEAKTRSDCLQEQ